MKRLESAKGESFQTDQHKQKTNSKKQLDGYRRAARHIGVKGHGENSRKLIGA